MSTSYAALAEMLKDDGMYGGIYGGGDETHDMFVSTSLDPAVEGFLSDVIGGDINIFGGIGLLSNIEDHDEDDDSHPDESPFIIAGKEDEYIIEDPVFDDIMEPYEGTTGVIYKPETPEEEHREGSESVKELEKETTYEFEGASEVMEEGEEPEYFSEFVINSVSRGGRVSDISKGITGSVSDIYF
jgi:hypothetical protein